MQQKKMQQKLSSRPAPRLIAVTGTIGAGKSSVLACIATLGFPVISLDTINANVLDMPPVIEKIGALWPTVVVPANMAGVQHRQSQGENADHIKNACEQQKIDRAALAGIVFSDSSQRALLEALTHPAIWGIADGIAQVEAMRASREGREPWVVIEVPLLARSERRSSFEKVIVVDAPEEIRIERLMRTRGYSREEARARMRSQARAEEIRAYASMIVENVGTPEALKNAVAAAMREITHAC